MSEAEEMTVLGRWIGGECGGPDAAISRLTRKLARMGGAERFAPLMETIQAVAQAGRGTLSPKQADALEDIKRAFRLS